jgi:ferredoxin
LHPQPKFDGKIEIASKTHFFSLCDNGVTTNTHSSMAMKTFEIFLLAFCSVASSNYFVFPVFSLSSPYGKTTRNIATQVLQGTGLPEVDLNQYNLPFSTIQDGWKANFVQKATESQGKLRLEPKNNVEHYVDAINVAIPRKEENGGGLGIELEEIAGGRSDGIGITIVSGLVPGGSAENSELLPGDCLSSVSLIRRKRQITSTGDDTKQTSAMISENEEEFSGSTECLDYERTVEAIGKTIPVLKPGFEDVFVLKVKRLRRLPKVSIRLQYPPEQNEPDATIEMYAGENLRQGMLLRGVKLNDPLAQRFDTKQGGNCGAGGLCRTCSVCVMSGSDVLNPQRVAEKQMLQDTPRWRLACKTIVGYGMKEGEMVVRVNPNQW